VSETKRYESGYGGGPVSAEQRLAEIMCERQAKKTKVSLGLMFWRDPCWARVYRYQLVLAKALFKKYDAAAVGRALRSPEGRNALTLNAKWLDPLFEREQAKLSRERAAAEASPPEEPAPPPPADAAPRPAFTTKQSLRSKLA
jgi:hypothetical protein